MLSNSEYNSICAKLATDEKFASLANSESKVEYIFKNVKPLLEFREAVHKVANNYRESHCKSLIRSQAYRKDAENMIKTKDYHNAIRLYSCAIVEAPLPTQGSDCKELQKCYTARANALVQMADFRNALHDIEKSLFLGTSNEMRFQKAFCLRALGRFGEAKQLVDSVIECKDYYKMDETPELLSQFQNLKVSLDKQHSTFGPNFPEQEEEVPNYDVWIDNRFELKTNERKGRLVVAKELIPKDSVIIAERPQNLTLMATNLLSYCNGCFKPIGTRFWPCIFCTEAVFCDRQCHDRCQADWHWYECGITGYLARTPFFQTYRMITKVDAEYAFKRANEEDRPPFNVMEWLQEFYGKDTEPVFRRRREERMAHYEGVLSLLDHENDYSVVNDARHCLLAIEAALLMEFKETFKAKDDQTFTKFVAFVVKMHRKSVTNTFSWNVNTPSGKVQIGSGTAIYAAFLNHSCQPNVIWRFIGDKIIFKTLRDVQTGEELNTNYGPNSQMSLHERQIILRTHYHFICNCELCKEQIRIYPALKCLKCSGPVLHLAEGKNPDACMECGDHYSNIKQVLVSVAHIRLDFDAAIKRVLKLTEKTTPPPRFEPQPQDIPDDESADDVQSEGSEEENTSDDQIEDKKEETVKPDAEESEEVPEEVPEEVVEPEINIETESQKEAKRAEIEACLQSADHSLKTLIDLHFDKCDEIFDLQINLSRLFIENDMFEKVVPHFERILSSIDWSKCQTSCRHWENLLFITKAYHKYLSDESSSSQKSEWKQGFKSFLALKQSYTTLKGDNTNQWTQLLTIDGERVEYKDAVKDLMREKKANFSDLKDAYKRLFSA